MGDLATFPDPAIRSDTRTYTSANLEVGVPTAS